jgi:hypothetical protein
MGFFRWFLREWEGGVLVVVVGDSESAFWGDFLFNIS